ncbi:MAG TPA: flagellar basal body rod protein FlgC [Phenylobacterium sp.]|jgi:flagellar basal-body rod protein FlgC|uniref:flagellar basal body rod protein FlgC n=1 Tax=Phenylobacterium sp. TaxID=1871053 RepID=UPI002B7BB0C6|nr:flagellar basal body rod protein FlgC [Phenylobacterium sp.]HXA40463.1 flagellar basal body rod protein FlgC [Phenylobacterium sp.]
MANDSTTLNTTQSIAVSALRAQQARMRIIAENLANANSTSKTPGGNPYRRQAPVFQATPVAGGGTGVKMVRAVPDQSPFNSAYDPKSPSADATGYVKTPNVDPLIEAMDMRDAQRAYEANLNVIETSRAMATRTLDLLKP